MTLRFGLGVAALLLTIATSQITAAMAAEKVRLQIGWDHQFTYAGFYAAQWQGYYEQAGLDVEIHSAISEDGKILRSPLEVAEGRAHFGSGAANVLVAIDQGAPLVIVASVFQQSPVAFFAKQGTGLRGPADLARLRVSRRVNDLLDVELQAMLRVEGIDPATVKPYPREQTLKGLVEGRVDVIPGFRALRSWDAKQLGLDVEILYPSSYGIDFYGLSLITHRRLVDDNPGLVERFKTASLKGWEYALKHPMEIADRISKELPRRIPLKDLAGFNRFEANDILKLTLYGLVPLGHTNPERWRRMHQHLMAAGIVKGDLDLNKLIFDPERRKYERQRFWIITAMVGMGIVLIIAMAVFVADRTLRRMLANRTRDLRESEASLANAQLIANLGNWDWDVVANSLRWSDQVYRIFGTNTHDFGCTYDAFLDTVHPDDRPLVEDAVNKALYEQAPYSIDHRIVLPSGEERIVHEQAEVTYDDSGEPLQMAGTVQDITVRKQAENELRQAQKMEAVGQLTGGIAHDFNNLLAVVQGNLDLAQRRFAMPTAANDLITEAIKAAEGGASLTQGLLGFSRKQTLQPELISLKDTVSGMSDLLRRTLGGSIEVDIVTDDELWICKVDPQQFENALLNLAINARDAMPDGGKLIIETVNAPLDGDLIAAQNRIEPGDYVMLSVRDSGSGISPDVLEHVFQPYFTTKGVGEGSGLGLSMVYGFARQSGGNVEISSEVGQGTTVKLYLPRDVATKADAPATAIDFGEVVGGDETLLVVEDDPAVRKVTVFMLEELGYRVLKAKDGPSAMAVLNKERVDLLFTDIVMPGGIRGDELTKLARERWPGLKVLHCSGYGRYTYLQSDIATLDHAVLKKPYQIEELAATMRQILDG